MKNFDKLLESIMLTTAPETDDIGAGEDTDNGEGVVQYPDMFSATADGVTNACDTCDTIQPDDNVGESGDIEADDVSLDDDGAVLNADCIELIDGKVRIPMQKLKKLVLVWMQSTLDLDKELDVKGEEKEESKESEDSTESEDTSETDESSKEESGEDTEETTDKKDFDAFNTEESDEEPEEESDNNSEDESEEESDNDSKDE